MSKYSTSFKQSVVSAYESGSEGFREVGARFAVDHSTVRKWVAIHAAHGLGLFHGVEDALGLADFLLPPEISPLKSSGKAGTNWLPATACVRLARLKTV
jgi:transposase-like protein